MSKVGKLYEKICITCHLRNFLRINPVMEQETDRLLKNCISKVDLCT